MSEEMSNKNDSNLGQVLGCLILLVLMGILSATAILNPNSTDRHQAKSVESRKFIGWMNRGQQAYFCEHNTYAESVNDLGLGIPLETQNYRYSTQSLDNAAFQYGISLHPEIFKRQPKIWGIFPRRSKEYALPSYLGVVWFKPNQNADYDETQSDLQMFSIFCKSTYPYLLEEGFQPSSQNGDFQCPEGMKELL